MFKLDSRLQQDTIFIGRLPLSQVLLMNDSRYIWLILVPARIETYEIYHLSEEDRIQLAKESSWTQEKLADRYAPDSMNVASLGNIVPQLHMHHVLRFKDDPAWPGPVWGHSEAVPYTPAKLSERVHEIKSLLGTSFVADMLGEDDEENYIDKYDSW